MFIHSDDEESKFLIKLISNQIEAFILFIINDLVLIIYREVARHEAESNIVEETTLLDLVNIKKSFELPENV